MGPILAAHAPMATGAVQQRQALEHMADTLSARPDDPGVVIGQAKGIPMERMELTPEDVSGVLQQASSRQLNETLHDIAVRVAHSA